MLVIDDVTLRIAGRSLMEGASAQDGARVGLAGRDGTGKSRAFAGRPRYGFIAPCALV